MKLKTSLLIIVVSSFLWGCNRIEDRGIIVSEITIPYSGWSQPFERHFVLNSFEDYKNYHFHLDSTGYIYNNQHTDFPVNYSSIDTTMENMPYVDFSRFTAFGYYIMADQKPELDLNVVINGTTYNYHVSYREHRFMDEPPLFTVVWVLVPKVPDGYNVRIMGKNHQL